MAEDTRIVDLLSDLELENSAEKSQKLVQSTNNSIMAAETCITDLPLDVMKIITSFLPLQDVSSLSCSSVGWRNLSQSVNSLIVDFDELSDFKAILLIKFLQKLLRNRGEEKLELLDIKCERSPICGEVISMVNKCLGKPISAIVNLHISSFRGREVEFHSRSSKEIEFLSLRFLSTQLNGLRFDVLQKMDLYNITLSDSNLSIGNSFPFLTNLIIEDCVNVETLVVVSECLKRFLFRDPEFSGIKKLEIYCSKLQKLSLIITSPSLQRTISMVCRELKYLHLEGFVECHDFRCGNFFCLATVVANLTFFPRSFYFDDAEEVECLVNFCNVLFGRLGNTTKLKIGADTIEALLDVGIEMPAVEVLDLNIQVFWQDEVVSLCLLLSLVPAVSVLTISRTHSWRRVSTVRRIRQTPGDLWDRSMVRDLRVLKIDWADNEECIDYKVKAELKVQSLLGVILNNATNLKNVQIYIKSPCILEEVQRKMSDYETLYSHVLFEYVYV